MRWIPRLLLTCSLIGGLACGDTALNILEPPVALQSSGSGSNVEQNIVRQSTSAEPLQTLSVSFWAVKGEDRRATIDYDLDPVTAEACDCGTFVRLRIRKESLVNRPDGTPIAEGDSILITVTVDPLDFLATLEPTGLQFDPEDQPQLKFWYSRADLDLNGDGVVDAQDRAILDQQGGIGVRVAPGQPFTRLDSEHDAARELFEVKLDHFSDYVVLW